VQKSQSLRIQIYEVADITGFVQSKRNGKAANKLLARHFFSVDLLNFVRQSLS